MSPPELASDTALATQRPQFVRVYRRCACVELAGPDRSSFFRNLLFMVLGTASRKTSNMVPEHGCLMIPLDVVAAQHGGGKFSLIGRS
jgi:hypothetical protein